MENLTKKYRERQRQIPYDITYNWTLISSTNEHLLRKENHGLGEQTSGGQGGGGGIWMIWDSGVNRCRLLPLEWIGNDPEKLLYIFSKVNRMKAGMKSNLQMYP